MVSWSLLARQIPSLGGLVTGLGLCSLLALPLAQLAAGSALGNIAQDLYPLKT